MDAHFYFRCDVSGATAAAVICEMITRVENKLSTVQVQKSLHCQSRHKCQKTLKPEQLLKIALSFDRVGSLEYNFAYRSILNCDFKN